jgi:hypothetical protein
VGQKATNGSYVTSVGQRPPMEVSSVSYQERNADVITTVAPSPPEHRTAIPAACPCAGAPRPRHRPSGSPHHPLCSCTRAAPSSSLLAMPEHPDHAAPLAPPCHCCWMSAMPVCPSERRADPPTTRCRPPSRLCSSGRPPHG